MRLGDAAADDERHEDAVMQYSAALSLNPPIPQDILVKRSKVYLARNLWKDALDDINRVCHFCLCIPNLVDMESLGVDVRSVLPMELYGSIERVGKSKIDRCGMEGSPG